MSKKTYYPCVLTIAGSDSSGGAGIQADIKAISATGCYAASVITALTAQNTQGVQGVFVVTPEFMLTQFESVFSDLKIDAVKIGMLHSRAVIDTLVATLKKYHPKNIILDPVMVAQSGGQLLQPDTVEYLKEMVFSLATLITPNIPEAEILLNTRITDELQMENAAITLSNQYKTDVLVKGGHLESLRASDVLYCFETRRLQWFHADRVTTRNTHGTGCTLSSAIASYLAQGYSLIEAVDKAKQYLTKAIDAASDLQLGLGCGPVDHFYFNTSNTAS